MIRPLHSKCNEQTAESNVHQAEIKDKTSTEIKQLAIEEFDEMVALLRAEGVNVIVVSDRVEPETPDSVFPNNWMAFHECGKVFTFPMEAPNRRSERRNDIFFRLKNELGFTINSITDLSLHEFDGKFMEGTGSVVWDRANNIAYASISSRTNEEVLDLYVKDLGAKAIKFHASEKDGSAVYHTNVVMCLAETFVVICLESIKSKEERKVLLQSFEETHKIVIDISLAQMNKYAGNMLQVKTAEGAKLVMSQQAKNALTQEQILQIEGECPIIAPSIYTIETIGGGSARCMMAEVFLPKK